MPLRVLTLNIQVGLQSRHYGHYFTQAWRHVLPSGGVLSTLDRIAHFAADYDIVALQEADAGSLRTLKLNQVQHLAAKAGFPYWHAAVTRNLQPIAQHCLGFLSRWPLEVERYHPLPGLLPGRGALEVVLRPAGYEPLRLIVVHLALSRGARAKQLNYIADLIKDDIDTLVMGDFNCGPDELETHVGIGGRKLRLVHQQHTYPAWAPARAIDHILASPTVELVSAQVLNTALSDHLPVAAEIRLRLERR